MIHGKPLMIINFEYYIRVIYIYRGKKTNGLLLTANVFSFYDSKYLKKELSIKETLE